MLKFPALRSLITLTGASILLVACSPAISGTTAESVELMVLGAASTRVVNEELAELSGHHLEFINAGSSTLVQQLTDGSPGDVLLTADRAVMDSAVESGVVADPVAFATNSMVMVVPAGNPAGITGVDDSLTEANVVLCDPQVPCGRVAAEIIGNQGYQVEAVSLEHSVADALGKVTSGEADAGWVYRSDAQAAGDAVEVIDIPGAGEVPNTLYAAVTADSTHPDQAAELVELIRGADMAAVWQDNGFTPTS
ncbi:molybdate ABC transporter substrate-binding protein [Corynebacterium occultum]|nr:molybdate ABC transporter substrate-binding protein [Corynebacterium occultum]